MSPGAGGRKLDEQRGVNLPTKRKRLPTTVGEGHTRRCGVRPVFVGDEADHDWKNTDCFADLQARLKQQGQD